MLIIMRIVLIGNYLPDGQESMERFAQLLSSGFQQAGLEVELWRPIVFFGALAKSTNTGLGKWLGYLDKWVLFPILLYSRLQNQANKEANTYFHICDHSNAPYIKYLPINRTVITCHDVLAIRGALGHADAYCPASGMGKILQRWILRHLIQAHQIICDSEMTLKQLYELSNASKINHNNWRVIHIGFNGAFRPMPHQEAVPMLVKAGLQSDKPFLLHVGSGHTRKNRGLLLDMVAALGNQWEGNICFAGQALDEELLTHAKSLGLANRVVWVRPDHDTLVALYSTCEAFIFPSFSEGFGWPLIEAQACGAPVIASNVAPMPEISGGTAIHVDPTQPQTFAAKFLSLKDTSRRAQIVREGMENTTRFYPNDMIVKYLHFYGKEFVNA